MFDEFARVRSLALDTALEALEGMIVEHPARYLRSIRPNPGNDFGGNFWHASSWEFCFWTPPGWPWPVKHNDYVFVHITLGCRDHSSNGLGAHDWNAERIVVVENREGDSVSFSAKDLETKLEATSISFSN